MAKKKVKKRNWREELEKAAMNIKNRNPNFSATDVPDFTPKKKSAGEKIQEAFDEARRKTDEAYKKQRQSYRQGEESQPGRPGGSYTKRKTEEEDVDIWDIDNNTPNPNKKPTNVIAGKLDGSIDPVMKKVDLPRKSKGKAQKPEAPSVSRISYGKKNYIGEVRSAQKKREKNVMRGIQKEDKQTQFRGKERRSDENWKGIERSSGQTNWKGIERTEKQTSWKGISQRSESKNTNNRNATVGWIKENGDRVKQSTRAANKREMSSGYIDTSGYRKAMQTKRVIQNAFDEEEKKKKNPYKGIRGN